MSSDIENNPEASALRTKRASAKRAVPPPPPMATTIASETLAATPTPVSVFERMNTRRFILFDPREKAPVIELGGHVPHAEMDDYVLSEFDAGETIVPAGCVTGVSRSLWQKGQHVRRDIYEEYVRRYLTPEQPVIGAAPQSPPADM